MLLIQHEEPLQYNSSVMIIASFFRSGILSSSAHVIARLLLHMQLLSLQA